MDKYEYKLKLEQMKSLAAEGKYEEAVGIVDSINWRKIKNINALVTAGEIYEQVGRYEDSKEVLLTAYDRSPIGRMIIYRLAEVAIKMENYDEAKEYYDEFVEIAPRDNLKYVLNYKISKAKKADTATLISILEQLNEKEYSEEWAYELATLYHQAGMAEKCVEACDDLILWFGDGPYVERALELKMLYAPLTESQERKYRMACQNRSGVVEVGPEDKLESGEIIPEPVEIPKVKMSPERFNTINLQEQLRESMREILQATEQETVADTMDNIKKMVEDNPYMQTPSGVEADVTTQSVAVEKPVAENTAFVEKEADEPKMSEPNIAEPTLQQETAEDTGEEEKSQPVMEAEDKEEPKVAEEPTKPETEPEEEPKVAEEPAKPETEPEEEPKVAEEPAKPETESEEEPTDCQEESEEVVKEPLIASEMSIEDVLAEWEKTRQAAERAIEQAEQRRLEEAKAKALQEAEDIMKRLSDVLPELDPETVAKELLENTGDDGRIGDDKATQMMMNMNQFLQKEIDRLSDENAQIDEQIAAVTEPEAISEEADSSEELPVTEEPLQKEGCEAETEADEAKAEEEALFAVAAGVKELMPETEAVMETAQEPEKTEATDDAVEKALLAETVRQMTQDAEAEKEEVELPKIEFPQELKTQEENAEPLPKIADAESFELPNTIQKLSAEQKEIFTYFVPIDGMEKQICQAMTGAILHLTNGKTASTGNMIIQGGPGSGKTVMATNMIKAIQQEIGKPNGKIGKIEAAALNEKDAASLLKKVEGGCLIIEKAGELSKDTAVRLSLLLEQDTSGVFVIMEDTKRGIQKALSQSEGFAAKFSEKINIPIFTSDELVTFAKSYANELGYTIDDMGVLALYNSISNIEHVDRATTLAEVKDVVDKAVEHSEKGGLIKAFSIITSRRYDADDYIILREKDFDA